eukprot:5918920-Amphidinium_carterae.1
MPKVTGNLPTARQLRYPSHAVNFRVLLQANPRGWHLTSSKDWTRSLQRSLFKCLFFSVW